jgi:hypothetical protein
VRSFGGTMAALMLAAIGGCTEAPRTVGVDTVLSHAHCHQLAPGVHRVTLDDVARLRGAQLLGFENDADDLPPAANDTLLLAVSLGQRPTAGYSLRADDSAELDDGVLTLRVLETRPGPTDMVAQVITHPCLVLSVPARGIERVRVVDRDGTPIGELTP